MRSFTQNKYYPYDLTISQGEYTSASIEMALQNKGIWNSFYKKENNYSPFLIVSYDNFTLISIFLDIDF